MSIGTLLDLFLQWAPGVRPDDDASCQVEFQLSGVRRTLDALDVSDVAFEAADPVRSFPAWRGRRHYDGAYWMESSGTSVPFESLTERACLVELDRRGGICMVSSQPMWVRWNGAKSAKHVPDYFARAVDGRPLLIDVKPEKHLDDDDVRAQFDRTATLAKVLGWTYLVFGGSSVIRDANLRFLMRFRGQPWRDQLGQFDYNGAVASIAEIAGQMGGGEMGLARCYYLIWNGKLSVDLEQPLSLKTLVGRGVT